MRKNQNRDHTVDCAYFITTVVKGRTPLLGEIKDGEVVLNSWGEIIKECWLELEQHYPAVILDRFVIMPDHFHGILFVMNHLLDGDKKYPFTEFVRAFKSFSSKKINEINQEDFPFRWQRSFHDKVIQNKEMLFQIRRYIRENPQQYGKK